MPFEIRRASLDDAAQVAGVHVASWQAAYAGLLPASFLANLTTKTREPMWRELLSNRFASKSDVFVALDGNRVAGFCSSGPAADEPDHMGELYTIYLLPEYWRMGLGRRLLDTGLGALSDQGFPEAVLWVLEGNERAIRFYESGGWTLDGGRKTAALGGILATELRYRTAVVAKP